MKLSIMWDVRKSKAMDDKLKKEILDVFDQWLALYEHGNPVLYTPAREYASDAVKDCRDVVEKLLDAALDSPADRKAET